jgi:hypothetical protein
MEKAEVLPRAIKWHFIGGLQSSMPLFFTSLPFPPTFPLSPFPLLLPGCWDKSRVLPHPSGMIKVVLHMVFYMQHDE